MLAGAIVVWVLFVWNALATNVKRGFGEGKTKQPGDLQALRALAWHYDWGMTPNLDQAPGLPEFVPMAWGRSEASTVTATNLTSINATAFLVLNEVNEGLQSNLTPEEACNLWPVLSKAAQGAQVPISSPTINNCEPGGPGMSCTAGPTEWLDDFVSVCPAAFFDFIAYHHYSCNADGVVSSVQAISSRYGKPVWLTEFACPGKNQTVNANFIKTIVPKLDALPDSVLGRYAWFAARISNKSAYVGTGASLMNLDGATGLSEVGLAYTSL